MREKLLRAELAASVDGYVEISLHTESAQPATFDDLRIRVLEKQVQENHYDPWGANLTGIESEGNPTHRYQFGGKEKITDLGIRANDHGARWLSKSGGPGWLGMDPLAEKFPEESPYAFGHNNPLRFIDPDGRVAVEGDYYSANGKHIGNDGVNDDKVYVTTSEVIQDNTQDGQTNWQAVKASDQTIDVGEQNQLGHETLQQVAARVHNETVGSNLTEKEKVASAMSNRLGDRGQGTWQKVVDRTAYWNDSHTKRMSDDRRNPPAGQKEPGTSVLQSNIREKNYQNFYNSSPDGRNDSPQMTSAMQAVLYIMTGGKDLVSGAKNWRGNGKTNRFF